MSSDWFTQTQTTNLSDFEGNDDNNDQVFTQETSEVAKEGEEWLIGGLYYKIKKAKNSKGKGNTTIFQNSSAIKTSGPQARKICFCEGQKHKYIANCQNCGHIICESEGPGVCLFCGEQVILPDSANNQNTNNASQKSSSSAKSPQKQKLENPKVSNPNFEKAIKQRNKLIEFDSNKENTVLDEQLDDVESTTNVWLSEEERSEKKKREEKLKKYREQRKNDAFFQIDFATGRMVLTDADHAITETDVDKKIKNMETSLKVSSSSSSQKSTSQNSQNFEVKQNQQLEKINEMKMMMKNPSIISPNLAQNLKFVANYSTSTKKNQNAVDWESKNAKKLQDNYFSCEAEVQNLEKQREVEEKDAEAERISKFKSLFFDIIPTNFSSSDVFTWTKKRRSQVPEYNPRDTFKVLCMHQPWASLLIEGIKIHEGFHHLFFLHMHLFNKIHLFLKKINSTL